MYLNGKNHLHEWNHCGTDEPISKKIQNLFPELRDIRNPWGKNSIIESITVGVGYWRKANAIHRWFVQHVQDGTDDCGTYHVGRDELKKLRDTCARVLEDTSLADEMLPPAAGFFLGSSEVDEYYIECLTHTISIINDALRLNEEWSFEYQSSW